MKILVIVIILCLLAYLGFSQNVDSAQYYFKKGMEQKNERLFPVASVDFEKAIQFNQNYTEAYIENGKVNLQMRRVDASIFNFSKAYELQPENKEVLNELSALYFNNHQYQKAIDMVQKCNDCVDADRILGMSFYHLEDYGKAVTFLQKAVNKNAKDGEAAYTLGRTYLELENEKKAIPHFESAIASEPSKNTWMYELGLVYYSQEDYKNALKYFDMAANAGYNKTNDFYENVGFAQLYTGDTESGMKTLAGIIERKPGNKELLNDIARAMYDTKHYDEALSYYQKILALDDRDAKSLFMAGMVFQKMGQKEKGQKICDKAIAIDPSLTIYRTKKDIPAGL